LSTPSSQSENASACLEAKKDKTVIFLSERSLPLVYSREVPVSFPVLTVELYPKWYSLHVIQPGGAVERLEFYELHEFCPPHESTYVDHVPNPSAVLAYAEAKDLTLDDLALELVLGRWVIEVQNWWGDARRAGIVT
jgi:hypothetical protein